MSDLVFIAFDNEKQAEEVRDKVLEMQREYLIEVDDAVVVVRDQNGRVKLNQLMHPAAGGAVAGAFWGMLIGWFFLMPVASAAVGAAGGALGGALVDVGINDQDMKQQANEALKPGTVGLFLLIRKMTTDKVLEDLKGVGGTVIRTSLDHAKEDALKTAMWRAIKSGRMSAESTEEGGAPNASLRQLPPPETIATNDLAAKLSAADAAISNIQELLGRIRTCHEELRQTLDDLKRDRDEWRGRAERLTERPWWRRLAG